MPYRQEIDGLRALAVVPVVLFHADVAGFSGGYVGVDVFFVLSGYLIASTIRSDLVRGRFTLAGFYDRRARRLLPALYVTMIAVAPLAWLMLLPGELAGYGASVAAAVLYVANVYFWQASDYFAPAAEYLPLLHTWSLSVEEQYYLLFPLAFLVGWRRAGSRVVVPILLLALASLAFAHWSSARNPTSNFYLLPSRGWELLAGAALAVAAPATFASPAARPGPVRELGALAGVALVAGAVLGFDDSLPFPSLYTLVPVTGALLVIGCASGTLAARLLSVRALVHVGLISYSVYLWHQPLLAFAHRLASEHPGLPATATAVGLAFALAHLSWRHVETPFRDRRRVPGRVAWSAFALASVALVATGLWTRANEGFPERLEPREAAWLAWLDYDEDVQFDTGGCFLLPGEPPGRFAARCAPSGTSSGAPSRASTLLWGDSHMAALAGALGERLPAAPGRYTAAACPPVSGQRPVRNAECDRITRFVLGRIARTRPAHVLLHANWAAYEGVADGLAATLAAIRRASPATEVTVLGGVAQWTRPLPILLTRLDVPLEPGERVPSRMTSRLRAADLAVARAAREAGAGFESLLDELCTDAGCLATLRAAPEELASVGLVPDGAGTGPIVFDDSHLSVSGARHVASLLASSPSLGNPRSGTIVAVPEDEP